MGKLSWDPLRPCTEVSDEEWTERLFGHSLRSLPTGADDQSGDDLTAPKTNQPRKHPVSRMVLAAVRVLHAFTKESHFDEAKDIAQDFYVRKFLTRKPRPELEPRLGLKDRREAKYTCAEFESLCGRHLRGFASAWVKRWLKKSGLSLDAPVSQDEGSTTFVDLVRDEHIAWTETEAAEFRAWFRHALDDLPSNDREIVESAWDEVLLPRDEKSELAATEKERAAKSRALVRLRMFCIVHGHTDNEEGKKVLDRAILAMNKKPEDDHLIRQRLLHGVAFDRLKTKRRIVGQKDSVPETDDEVRFRFVGCVERIYVICDPWRLHAIHLLPRSGGQILRAAFMPWRPMVEVASLLGCTLPEVHSLYVRKMMNDLRTLLDACYHARTLKGRESLQNRADHLPDPGKSLVVRVLLQKEPLEKVAADLELSADEARCALLGALQAKLPKSIDPTETP